MPWTATRISSCGSNRNATTPGSLTSARGHTLSSICLLPDLLVSATPTPCWSRRICPGCWCCTAPSLCCRSGLLTSALEENHKQRPSKNCLQVSHPFPKPAYQPAPIVGTDCGPDPSLRYPFSITRPALSEFDIPSRKPSYQPAPIVGTDYGPDPSHVTLSQSPGPRYFGRQPQTGDHFQHATRVSNTRSYPALLASLTDPARVPNTRSYPALWANLTNPPAFLHLALTPPALPWPACSTELGRWPSGPPRTGLNVPAPRPFSLLMTRVWLPLPTVRKCVLYSGPSDHPSDHPMSLAPTRSAFT